MSKKVHLQPASLTAGHPEFEAPTLTVGQIAEKLRAIAPDPSVTVERVRHWTRENLVSPLAQHHAGTGKHRRYGHDTLFDAAILTAIANIGLPIVTQDYLVNAFPRIRRALQNWDQRSPLFLEISRGLTETSDPRVIIHKGVVNPHPAGDVSLTINLSNVVGPVLKERLDRRQPSNRRGRSNRRPEV